MISASRWRLRRRKNASAPAGPDAHRHLAQDRALAQRLFHTIERDMALADIQGIHFYVQHGTVTLFGTVRTPLDVDLLTTFVRQIPGVRGVVKQLQVIDARFQPTEAAAA